jgi:hypothetical protein
MAHNVFGLGEGGDFYHKTSYEERKFKYSTNCHTKHRTATFAKPMFTPIKLEKILNIEADFSLSTLLKNDHNSKNILRFEKVFSPSKQKS